MNKRLVALLLAFSFTSLSAKAQYNPPAGGVTQIIAGSGVTISPLGGTGAVTVNSSGGGGGSPGGATTQVQYNNAGAFGADSGFTRNPSTKETNIQKLLETTIQGAFHLGTVTFPGPTSVLGAFHTATDTATGNFAFAGAGDFSGLGQTTTTAAIGSLEASGAHAGVFTAVTSGSGQAFIEASSSADKIDVTVSPTQFNVSGNTNGTQFTLDDSAQTYTFNKLGGSGSRMVTTDNSGVLGTAALPSSAALTLTSTCDWPMGVVIGEAVYSDGAGTFNITNAASANANKIIGLVSDVSIGASAPGNIITSGLLVATTAQWDAVAGTTGGLAAGTWYYLDPSTAGHLTSVAPTTVGQYVAPIGLALSTTNLLLRIGPTVLL